MITSIDESYDTDLVRGIPYLGLGEEADWNNHAVSKNVLGDISLSAFLELGFLGEKSQRKNLRVFRASYKNGENNLSGKLFLRVYNANSSNSKADNSSKNSNKDSTEKENDFTGRYEFFIETNSDTGKTSAGGKITIENGGSSLDFTGKYSTDGEFSGRISVGSNFYQDPEFSNSGNQNW